MTQPLSLKHFRRHKMPALVLLGSLFLSLLGWRGAAQLEQTEAQARFDDLADDYRQSLAERMATYARVLIDLQGVFQAGGVRTRRQFDALARHIGIDHHLPGVLRLGYIPAVPAAARQAFEARVRSEGFPDFRIKAAAWQPVYYPVDYLYPVNREVLGLEMAREPVRRAGLEKARDTDQPIVTGKTVVLSDPRHTPAFFIFVPIYRADAPHATVAARRHALQGYAFAAFLAEDLLRDTWGHDYRQKTDLAIFDGRTSNAGALLYATTPRAADAGIMPPPAGLRVWRAIDVGGRVWTLSFLSKPDAVPNDYAGLPGAVLFTGLLITLLLTSIAAQGNARRRLKWEKDEQNQRFRSLFEQHPDAVFALDPQGCFVDANPATLQMTGFSLAELRKKTWRDFIAPELLADSEARVVSTINGQTSYGETTVIGPRGERIELGTTNLPIVVNGQIVGLFGIARDITQHKRAEAALAATRERLDSILASMEDVVWSCSPDDRQLIFMNPAVETIYGRSAEMFHAHPGLGREAIHPEDRALADSFMPALLQKGRIRMRYRIVRPDGGVRWVKNRARVIRDADGRAVRLDGIITDITEQVTAEREAEKQKQLLAAVIDTLPLNIFIRNAQSCMLMVNECAAKTLGHPKDEIIGKSLVEIFPLDVAKKLRQADQLVLQSGRSQQFEEKTIHQGQECYMLAGKTSLDLGDGMALLLGYSIDITARRQAEEALRCAHDELEDKIRARTEELQQANHALRELSSHLHSAREEERTRLAREIHDQLGGTLAAIKFELSLAMSPGQSAAGRDAELQTAVQLVDEAVQSLRQIITDLRPSLLDEVSLWAALDWLAGDWQSRIGIPCEFELLGEELDLDPDRATALFRIAQEALTNIMKHAKASKVHILAETSEEEVRVSIHDNGQGATPDQLANPTAFGIAGMHERARAYGGAVVIDSRPEKGTSVHVTLPCGVQSHNS